MSNSASKLPTALSKALRRAYAATAGRLLALCLPPAARLHPTVAGRTEREVCRSNPPSGGEERLPANLTFGCAAPLGRPPALLHRSPQSPPSVEPARFVDHAIGVKPMAWSFTRCSRREPASHKAATAGFRLHG